MESEEEMQENIDKEKETAEAESSEAKDTAEQTPDNEQAVEDTEAEACEETESSDEEDTDKQKKSFFKKKEKKDKKDEKIDELSDRLMRTMAEFDNFRKRTEREKSQMFEVGAKDIIEKILPVIDNFERGFAGKKEEELEGAFETGMYKVYKQMLTALEASGVKAIDAVGQQFDPNFHNAVMHIEDESLGENVVAEEFQKGYMYRDTVVRHSMVKVAN